MIWRGLTDGKHAAFVGMMPPSVFEREDAAGAEKS